MQNFFLPSINLERTGENIKRLRSDAHLSTAELSEILGFTGPQAIYKWQNGQCLPTVDNLVILSRIFHTSIENILVLNEGQDVVVLCSFFSVKLVHNKLSTFSPHKRCWCLQAPVSV